MLDPIQEQLYELFKQSQLYVLLSHLRKTPNCGFPASDPTPTSFSVTSQWLHSLCYCSHHLNLVSFLSAATSQGLTVFQQGPIFIVSHPSLTPFSPSQQIFKAWLEASLTSFYNDDNFLSRLYDALRTSKNATHWDDTGETITFEKRIRGRFDVKDGFQRYGWRLKEWRDRYEACHQRLTRAAKAEAWLLVYLLQKREARRKMEEQIRKEQESVVKIQHIDEISPPLQPQRQPQPPKPFEPPCPSITTPISPPAVTPRAPANNPRTSKAHLLLLTDQITKIITLMKCQLAELQFRHPYWQISKAFLLCEKIAKASSLDEKLHRLRTIDDIIRRKEKKVKEIEERLRESQGRLKWIEMMRKGKKNP